METVPLKIDPVSGRAERCELEGRGENQWCLQLLIAKIGLMHCSLAKRARNIKNTNSIKNKNQNKIQ